MTMPKAGSRKIVVEGTRFRWRIRKRITYAQQCFGQGLGISVELEESPSGKLFIGIKGENHPSTLVGKPGGSVKPSDIAGWIREALQSGWEPANAGQEHFISVQREPQARN